jgi:hypothetical protein
VNSLRVIAACLHRKGIRALVPSGWRAEPLDGQLQLQLHNRVLVIGGVRIPHAVVTDRGILTKSPAMLGLPSRRIRAGDLALHKKGLLHKNRRSCSRIAARPRRGRGLVG